MDYLGNVFGLMLVLGIIALIVVAVLYFYQKKKVRHSKNPAMVESGVEVIETADRLVALNSDSLRAFLSPLRNDQPVFIHNVANLLERAKKRSDIKIIRVVTEQLEAQSALLSKIDEYEEQFHALTRKTENFKQSDELQDLTHKRDKRRILNEIENLVDEAGGIEKARRREYENLESELNHQFSIDALRADIRETAEEEKRLRKNKQLDEMIAIFEVNSDAIKSNQKLTPSARKETLRTLEQTFIAQLDEFKREL